MRVVDRIRYLIILKSITSGFYAHKCMKININSNDEICIEYV